MTLIYGTVLAAALLAAVADVRSRRIPNQLVAALAVAGLIENALLFGWMGALADLAVTAIVLIAGTAIFSLKLIGGGDVKLMAAGAGALAYPGGILFILFTLLCGGLLGAAYAAMRGRVRATLANIRSISVPLFLGVRPARPEGGLAMPYAVAIFAGTLCTAALSAAHVRLLP